MRGCQKAWCSYQTGPVLDDFHILVEFQRCEEEEEGVADVSVRVQGGRRVDHGQGNLQFMCVCVCVCV